MRSSGQQSNGRRKFLWKVVFAFLGMCGVIFVVICKWNNTKSETVENIQDLSSNESHASRWRKSENRLGITHIPQERLNVSHRQYGDEKDDDEGEAIVTQADLIVRKRQNEDSIVAERAKVAEQKQQRQMELFLAEMKRNGGNKEAAWQVANESITLSGDELVSLADSLKLEAKERNDPSLIRDFEAAFENQTGISLDLKTADEKQEDKILTKALTYVKNRYEQNLRRNGLSESDLLKYSIDASSGAVRQLIQDRMRIEAYKKELFIR